MFYLPHSADDSSKGCYYRPIISTNEIPQSAPLKKLKIDDKYDYSVRVHTAEFCISCVTLDRAQKSTIFDRLKPFFLSKGPQPY